MKYAYLIIVHNEFDILQRLIYALDDERNDIYIHFDRKVKSLPDLKVNKSRLFVIDRRVDVRWGSVTQISCEYRLWEEAVLNGPYNHYILLSGTHLPLVPVNRLTDQWSEFSGKNLICGLGKEIEYQEIMKVHRYNLFMRGFAYGSKRNQIIHQWLWKVFLAIQKKLGIRRNDSVDFWRGSNWVVLSHEAVAYILSRKEFALRIFKMSFCADEYLVPTLLMSSHSLKETLIDAHFLLFQDMMRANARELTLNDYNDIRNSNCLFARKFSSANIDLVNKLSI